MKILFALFLLIPLFGCAAMGEFAGGAASGFFQPHYRPDWRPQPQWRPEDQPWWPQFQPRWHDDRRCSWYDGRRWCRR